MGKKVTYGKSDNGKRHLPCDTDSAHEHEDSRKRSKTDDELEKLRFPGRQAKKSSLLKKSLHSGPVSFTNEDGDIEPPKKKNVFDKVLSEGRYQAAKPGQVRFSGDRNGFAGLMRKNQRSEEHEGRKRNSYLPTPPADAERKAHQQTRRDTTFSHTNGSASKGGLKTPSKSATPTQTSQLFERVIKYEQPKQPYQPKAYKADETPAPAMDILGGRLPEKSKEAELWSKNQTESPFLRLPSHVRKAIYEYALGSKTVNIEYETYRRTYKTNKVQKSTPVFKYHCTVYEQKRMNPFGAKTYESSSGFTLLNNICRALYQETAVMPYLNLICFGTHNIMFNFLFMEKRLSREQLDAFNQILLRNELPGSNMLGFLPNLEKVYLADDHNGKAKGWYYVTRKEGEEPKLQRKVQ